MFRILKNAYWAQELVIKFITRRHAQLDHSLEKFHALKKAFHFVNLENVSGDYLEFGMFEGTSFICALESHMATKGPATPARTFWGFDSFEGLRFGPTENEHASLIDGDFRTSYEFVQRRIGRRFRNRAKWHITKGFLQDTIAGKTASDLGVERAAVVLCDLDLEEPTRIALEFVKPVLQEGSVVILDEPFLFRGSSKKGEAAAFNDFCEQNPQFEFRRYFDYGHGGRGYILAAIRNHLGEQADQVAD